MNSRKSRRMRAYSSNASPTATQKDRRSCYRTAQLLRDFPDLRLWLWDGEFCGSIGLRWQPGTAALPPHVLGHIGYAIVPWKGGRGYAKLAVKQMLEHARDEGLEYVEITTDPDNVAPRRVIEANGGILLERFKRPVQYGRSDALRSRIAL